MVLSTLVLRLLAAPTQSPAINPPVAIVGVTVIPMDQERRLRNQTVVVDGGRITAVGPVGDVSVPTGATIVSGRGRFIIPGLFDMHAHLQSDGRLPDSLAPDELALFLANGVTTVRLMIGTPEHLVLRRELRAGRIQGPDLVIGSPQLAGKAFGDPFNGYAVATPAEAAAAVRRANAEGYDFIKVTFFISRAVYDPVAPMHRLSSCLLALVLLAVIPVLAQNGPTRNGPRPLLSRVAEIALARSVLQGGGLTIELIQHDDARPLREAAPDAKGALFVHGVFKVGVVVENYAEALATLRARQVEIAMGPFPARGDQPANLIIKDNAGNLIQVLAK